MKRLALSITHMGRELMDKAMGSIRTVVELVKDGVFVVIEWHRQRMIVDPIYPKTLLTIGKALVTLFIPSALVATAVIALLADLLGAYQSQFGQDDDYSDWSDPDWN
jgi:hypothetical protein